MTAFAPSYGGEGLWSVGVRSEGFIDLEPGQDWVIGPEIGYSDFNLAAHRLQFKAAYLTSRLEQSFRQNLLRQDYFLLSPVWHFGRNRLFDPTVQLDLGYWRYDVESDLFRDLDNDSWVAAARSGASTAPPHSTSKLSLGPIATMPSAMWPSESNTGRQKPTMPGRRVSTTREPPRSRTDSSSARAAARVEGTSARPCLWARAISCFSIGAIASRGA